MLSGMVERALLHRIMEENRKRLAENRAALAVRGQSDREPDEAVPMTETRIYIGLNDSQTREQLFATEKYMDVLKKVCRSYHVAFSVDVENGGYYHDDGEYTEETSFILVLINTDRDVVREIAKDLCVFFHQESVLVTENRIEGYFIGAEKIG